MNASHIILLEFVSKALIGMSISIFRKNPSNPDSFEPVYWNGIYTGIKYQCVELARRYYLARFGTLFDDVVNARDIFSLHTLKDLMSGRIIFWQSYINISTSLPPMPGSLLVWMTGDNFQRSGHVAVVVSVTKNYVYIIEQNYGQGKRKLPYRNGVIVSPGLIGWKMPPYMHVI